MKPIEGSQELLHAAGFRSKMIPNNEGIEEEFLVFEQENVDSLDSINVNNLTIMILIMILSPNIFLNLCFLL